MSMNKCIMALLTLGLVVGIVGTSAANLEPRGVRNHNPLNIKQTDEVWRGQVRCDDGVFACFDSAFYGIRAGAIVLHTYHHIHGIDSLRGMVERWAPSHENDTEAFYGFVKDQMEGVSTIGPENLDRLLEALILAENGIVPYSPQLIREAVDVALSNRDYNDDWFGVDGRAHEISRHEAGDEKSTARDEDGDDEATREKCREGKGVQGEGIPMDPKDHRSIGSWGYHSPPEAGNSFWLDGLTNRLHMDGSKWWLLAFHQPERNCPDGGCKGDRDNSPRYPSSVSHYWHVFWREPRWTQPITPVVA